MQLEVYADGHAHMGMLRSRSGNQHLSWFQRRSRNLSLVWLKGHATALPPLLFGDFPLQRGFHMASCLILFLLIAVVPLFCYVVMWSRS